MFLVTLNIYGGSLQAKVLVDREKNLEIRASSGNRPAKSEKFPTTGISRIEISPKRA